MRAAVPLFAVAAFAAAGAAWPDDALAVCSVFDKRPCAPTTCSVYQRSPCLPDMQFLPGDSGLRFTIQHQPQDIMREEGRAPNGPLNTLNDISNALRGCWKWPPASEITTGMDLSILLSFRRNGEIFGARITYQSKNVSPEEKTIYYGALMDMLKLCSPLPLSDSLGHAVAGRPMIFRFHDTRKERKA